LNRRTAASGFTLIEMSIVLVVIGLIVGGVLVGQDLIRAAGVRATISQIEKYNTATNTFRDKYGGLPGDLNAASAAQFGFIARGSFAGEGDGNGVIEGMDGNMLGRNSGRLEGSGETGVFWVDLSMAGLIDNSFNTAVETNPMGSVTAATTPNLASYFPPTKLGAGNYIYVWSGGLSPGETYGTSNGVNYFGISAITSITPSGPVNLSSDTGLTIAQAYSIDKKIDDGIPQSGNVMAMHLNGGPEWAYGSPSGGGDRDPTTYGAVVAGDGVATSPSTLSCYDNAGVAGATEQYSMAQNGGTSVNCALSFRFQ
jgi:prepilin-type N-terminal cleavage/methylation domain-containing protein